jgi:hypothetical protein
MWRFFILLGRFKISPEYFVRILYRIPLSRVVIVSVFRDSDLAKISKDIRGMIMTRVTPPSCGRYKIDLASFPNNTLNDSFQFLVLLVS